MLIKYWYNIDTGQVEEDREHGKKASLLGPYATREAAANALRGTSQRAEAWAEEERQQAEEKRLQAEEKARELGIDLEDEDSGGLRGWWLRRQAQQVDRDDK